MNSKLNALCLAGLLLTSFMAKPALADDWNERTKFQFSAPVKVPGKLLAAGKYVFELANSQSDRNIVQIFSEDSKGNERLVATIMAIPDYVSKTPDKPMIQFEEGHTGAPEAIHGWFYRLNNSGWEFVYSKGQGL
jgi:hypothetical protein